MWMCGPPRPKLLMRQYHCLREQKRVHRAQAVAATRRPIRNASFHDKTLELEIRRLSHATRLQIFLRRDNHLGSGGAQPVLIAFYILSFPNIVSLKPYGTRPGRACNPCSSVCVYCAGGLGVTSGHRSQDFSLTCSPLSRPLYTYHRHRHRHKPGPSEEVEA